ncbi:MAG: hypothetical protein AAGD01_09640 [Acidobacteriota bacterium]
MIYRFVLLLACLCGSWSTSLAADGPSGASAGLGEWLAYPLEARVGGRSVDPLTVIYSAQIARAGSILPAEGLAPAEEAVKLRIRCRGSFEIRLDGQRLEGPRGESPRPGSPSPCGDGEEVSLGRWTEGFRQLEIAVTRAGGPPLLYLELRGATLAQRGGDDSREEPAGNPAGAIWASLDGLAPAPARRASRPALPTAAFPGVEGVWAAVGPWLLLGLLIGALWGWWGNRQTRSGDESSEIENADDSSGGRKGVLLAAAVILLVSLGLAGSSIPHLAPTMGFDAEGHWEYVDHLLREGSLPRADQGWQMYHPPLYHGLAAMVLGSFGMEPKLGEELPTAPAAATLRWLGALLSALQVGLSLLLAAWVMGPTPHRRWLLGLTLLFALALPVHRYPFAYVSNEPLAGVLALATLALAARLLAAPTLSWKGAAALGGVWGLALATKVSTLMLAPGLAVAFGWRWWCQRREFGPDGPWLRRSVPAAAAFGASALAVGGFHYFRLTRDFGSPLVGNWSPQLGFRWWQDPGWRQLADYLPTGRALTDPFFAGFASVPDGFWGTLWADGLAGGQRSVAAGPPWNWQLQSASSLLALIPSLLLLLGLAALVKMLINSLRGTTSRSTQSQVATPQHHDAGGADSARSAQRLLIFVTLLSGIFALLVATWQIPSYAQAKAFYLLPVSGALVALVPLGLSWVGRWGDAARAATGALLGAWAVVSLASFWVADSPSTDLAHARALLAAGEGRGAETLFLGVAEGAAGASEEQRAEAFAGAAAVALGSGRQEEGTLWLQRALTLDPQQPEAQRLESLRLVALHLSTLARSEDPADPAVVELQERALALAEGASRGPDGRPVADASTWRLLAQWRYAAGDFAGAARALAQALRRTPEDRALRQALGQLSAAGFHGEPAAGNSSAADGEADDRVAAD